MGRALAVLAFAIVLVFANENEDYEDNNHGNSTTSTPSNSTTMVFTKVPEKSMNIEVGAKLVKLLCEVQNLDPNNTKVNLQWFKNEAPVDRGRRLSVKNARENDKVRSTLRITNLDVFDKGYYECVAFAGQDEIRHETLLNVSSDYIPPPPASGGIWGNGGGGSTSSHRYTSSKVDMEVPTTAPNLAASAVFDQHLIPNKEELEAAIKSGKMQKTFDLVPSGGSGGGGGGGGGPSGGDDGIGGMETMMGNHGNGKLPSYNGGKRRYNASEPFCQVYRGTTCAELLNDKYVFVQPPYTQKEIEQKLANAFLVISQSNDISSSCNKFAKPSLCYSAFPLCGNPREVMTYQTTHSADLKDATDFKDLRNSLDMSLRRICKSDCLMLETELCSKEYAIAKRHPVIGQTLELEECEFLPDIVSKKYCLGLSVDRERVNKDDTCYWDDGRSYRGIQGRSQSGKGCLRWSHQFHVPLSEHPELAGHNYCRNPGGQAQQPFCYVDQNEKEICDIAKCAHEIGIYIIVSLTSLVVAVVVTVMTWHCFCRKKNKPTRNLQNMNIPTADKNIYGKPGPNSPMEMNTLLPPNIPPVRGHHQSKNGFQNVLQYTYKEVAFVEELGEGAFGKVYKGELKTKQGKIFVAVKSLKENASAKTQADFQREIELISELKHPNIICLMGVVVKQEPMCMLFEFMSEGDLHEFLISNSPGEGKSLTQNQFLHVAIQIAQGMEYLSENHYVHRDLAARNCLVSKDLVVKISDFGLSRDMYSCDYYRVQSKSLLPVRWMPPESILYGKFTTESDVWSYGVVLWEIYSYGLQPYYGYNNQEVINMIRSRKLLPCPDACPSYCYALMVECWAELAIRRPSFGEISHRLRVWKQNGNSNGAYFKTATPNHHIHPHQQQLQQHQHQLQQQQQPGSVKSSHTSESQTVVCPTEEQVPPMWDRNRGLNESQSSLTSRSSSLGNRTQSTNLSTNEGRGPRRGHRRKDGGGGDSLDRGASLPKPPKNTMVCQANGGDNFEIKVTR